MDRATFIKLGLITSGGLLVNSSLGNLLQLPDQEKKMPVLFIGHGAPTNVLADNSFTKDLKKLGKKLPTPKAILIVSAHWLTKKSYVSAAQNPKVLYDFYGFPDKMYEIKYPAPGAPDFAKSVPELEGAQHVIIDNHHGLDHGAWTVLYHMFPDAEVPCFQLSIDFKNNLQYHYDLGKALYALRKKGVLILGSGNITHNFAQIDLRNVDAKPLPWAAEFDDKIKKNLKSFKHKDLVNYDSFGKLGKLAHPTLDHYIPLLYSAGASDKNDKISFPHESFHYGGFSMRCVQFG